MKSWILAYIQIHQIIQIKYVQFFVYQLYLNKVVYKNPLQLAQSEVQ